MSTTYVDRFFRSTGRVRCFIVIGYKENRRGVLYYKSSLYTVFVSTLFTEETSSTVTHRELLSHTEKQSTPPSPPASISCYTYKTTPLRCDTRLVSVSNECASVIMYFSMSLINVILHTVRVCLHPYLIDGFHDILTGRLPLVNQCVCVCRVHPPPHSPNRPN